MGAANAPGSGAGTGAGSGSGSGPARPSWPQVFLGCASPREDADVVLFGAPFDGTVSYRPGSRFAPMQMRVESMGFETYSPSRDADLEDRAVHDAGDLELAPGNAAAAISRIEATATRIFEEGKRPFLVGGEHLVTLGVLRAAFSAHPALHVVHFDAHSDTRADYLGEPLSHACVMRRAHDLLGDGRIHSFGIRSGTREEYEWSRHHLDLHRDSLADVADVCRRLAAEAVPVYFTVDLDVLDPSAFPGTGTPEPGGVSFRELQAAFDAIDAAHLQIIGADLVELAPQLDATGISTAAACRALREMLLLM